MMSATMLIDAAFYFCMALLCTALFWILVLIVITSLRGFWIDKESLIRDLEEKGYSEIKILRHSWFLIVLRGGGKNGVAKFVISAKNPQGKRKEFDILAGPK